MVLKVVLTRADLYHMCSHPLVEANTDEVIAPEGEGGTASRIRVLIAKYGRQGPQQLIV